MQSSRLASSLYVGDLSPEVTEEDLIHTFSLNVPVVSVHLCRNPITGESKCALINFDSHLTASNAMAFLNHTELKGKPMEVMWCHMEDRRTGFGEIYSSIASSGLERIVCPSRPLQSWSFGFLQMELVPKAAEFPLIKEFFTGLFKEVYQFAVKKVFKSNTPFVKQETNQNPPPIRLSQLTPKETPLSQYLKRNTSNHRSEIEKHFPRTYSLAQEALKRG